MSAAIKDEVVIVREVHKSFEARIRNNTLKDLLSFGKNKKGKRRKVLKEISFSVKKGEAVGLIGRNGCGKSTILKLLTKILYPDSGIVEVKGRVASLIELGAGFHPDMTGRENIYINASIFGIKNKEVDEKIEEIISFSELGDFIDEPVKNYSSGMYMRLAFSVAVNVNPDVLLIDEILAVGDAKFQEKCFRWIESMKKKGVTIIIVSHSFSQLERICDRVLWIDKGRVIADGYPHEICNQYLLNNEENDLENNDGKECLKNSNNEKTSLLKINCSEWKRIDYDITYRAKLNSVEYIGLETNSIYQSDEMYQRIDYDLLDDISSLTLQIIIRKIDGRPVSTGFIALEESGKGNHKVGIHLGTTILAPGIYSVQYVLIHNHENGYMEKIDALDDVCRFKVLTSNRWDGETWGNTVLKIGIEHAENKG